LPIFYSTLGGIQTEWRYTVLEEQKFGRFSFNGQNPEVEVSNLINF
jgi:hypothetical protein